MNRSYWNGALPRALTRRLVHKLSTYHSQSVLCVAKYRWRDRYRLFFGGLSLALSDGAWTEKNATGSPYRVSSTFPFQSFLLRLPFILRHGQNYRYQLSSGPLSTANYKIPRKGVYAHSLMDPLTQYPRKTLWLRQSQGLSLSCEWRDRHPIVCTHIYSPYSETCRRTQELPTVWWLCW